MAIVVRDQHGTFTAKRKKGDGEPLHRKTARYFAVVDHVWSKGYAGKSEARAAETRMKGEAKAGTNLASGSTTLAAFIADVWLPAQEAKAATGYGALYYNTTGNLNTATGVYALESNTTGSENTASAYGALHDALDNVPAFRRQSQAVWSAGQTVSYGDLDKWSAALAADLSDRGVAEAISVRS